MRTLLEAKRDEIVARYEAGTLCAALDIFDALDELIDLADANVIEEQPIVAVQVASIDTIADMFTRSLERLKTDVLQIVAQSCKATRNPRAPKAGKIAPKKGAAKTVKKRKVRR